MEEGQIKSEIISHVESWAAVDPSTITLESLISGVNTIYKVSESLEG
jgi:hypothetical protein